MSTTIFMQDWVTIQGSSASTEILQPEPQWIDLGPFQDVTTYIELADFVTEEATVAILSAPVKETPYFRLLSAAAGSAGLFITKIPWAGAQLAPSRWLLWRCTASDPDWSITFRISLNVNPAA